jgi:hypothetical protein
MAFLCKVLNTFSVVPFSLGSERDIAAGNAGTQVRFPVSGSRFSDPDFKSGFRFPVSGFRFLVSGFWFPVSGFWLPVSIFAQPSGRWRFPLALPQSIRATRFGEPGLFSAPKLMNLYRKARMSTWE